MTRPLLWLGVGIFGLGALFDANAQAIQTGEEQSVCRSPVFTDAMGSDPDCDFVGIWPANKPKPGHPTRQEKKSFVDCLSKAAIKAEQIYHVPAAGLVAIAIVESNYGFSRLALNTNNTFGFRFPIRNVPEGVTSRTFRKCPPDQKNLVNYAQFADYGNGVLFVAKRLAEISRYVPATERYSRIAEQVRCFDDIIEWVAGVGKAGFHTADPSYLESIRRILLSEVELPTGRRALFMISASQAQCRQP